MTGARAFVDTNVLIYSHDTSNPIKQERARVVIGDLWRTGHGCVSIQILQELFVTLIRKAPEPLTAIHAAEAVRDVARWTVHSPVPEDVLAAIDLRQRAQISFWDAMILRSAAALGCSVLYTEDLNAGQRYDGVEVVNPFAGASNGAGELAP